MHLNIKSVCNVRVTSSVNEFLGLKHVFGTNQNLNSPFCGFATGTLYFKSHRAFKTVNKSRTQTVFAHVCRLVIPPLILNNTTIFANMTLPDVETIPTVKRCTDMQEHATTLECVSTGEVMTFVVSIPTLKVPRSINQVYFHRTRLENSHRQETAKNHTGHLSLLHLLQQYLQ